VDPLGPDMQMRIKKGIPELGLKKPSDFDMTNLNSELDKLITIKDIQNNSIGDGLLDDDSVNYMSPKND